MLRLQRGGDANARDALFRTVYDELRRRARDRVRRRSQCGIDRTALVHEACAKLLARDANDARDRRRFFAIFTCAMRDVLIDSIRREQAQRRGGDRRRTDLVDFATEGAPLRVEMLIVEEALAALRAVDEEAAMRRRLDRRRPDLAAHRRGLACDRRGRARGLPTRRNRPSRRQAVAPPGAPSGAPDDVGSGSALGCDGGPNGGSDLGAGASGGRSSIARDASFDAAERRFHRLLGLPVRAHSALRDHLIVRIVVLDLHLFHA
ncbi:MAG TPA: ECF-type sigma factor [Phycisphaerales bacterium]|nr:ECF-type sigma factor [Phycisphaerales bacterium]HMP36279.1 ECF-type sigma factor [Phycisphaerales bacterium]